MDLSIKVKIFMLLKFFISEVLLIGFFVCRQLSENMNSVVSS